MVPSNVLITGGNRGIGLQLVKEFLKHSDVKRVFATSRNPENDTELKSISDPRLTVVKMDVTCDESIEQAYNQVDEVLKDEGLNMLINNAGIFVLYNPKEKPNRSELLKQLNVNSVSPVIVSQIFRPLLLKAIDKSSSSEKAPHRAAIINISSTGGSIYLNDPILNPNFQQPTRLAYCVSKTALNSAAKVLANEFGKDGILVASFCPGWVQTDMGGSNAELTLEQSVGALVPTILKLKAEDNGGYFKHTGEPIPY